MATKAGGPAMDRDANRTLTLGDMLTDPMIRLALRRDNIDECDWMRLWMRIHALRASDTASDTV
jgi:hypothetical protein